MATSSAPQTMAGHPIAMKVGGRRMSLSKSPSANKSYLAGSPPKDAPLQPTEEKKDETAHPLSPSADEYPRPEEHKHHDSTKDNKDGKAGGEGDAAASAAAEAEAEKQKEKENKQREHQREREEEQQHHANKKKEKQNFDNNVKQQNFNKNPPVHNNFNIKQPAGKVL